MESLPQNYVFERPDFNAEIGEFERTAKVFGVDESALLFLAEEGNLIDLSEEVWANLENTDSFEIGLGDWGVVESHTVVLEPQRDWKSIQDSLINKEKLPAPIIVKKDNSYYLISGNTRLMVSRALGIIPKVWIFEMN